MKLESAMITAFKLLENHSLKKSELSEQLGIDPKEIKPIISALRNSGLDILTVPSRDSSYHLTTALVMNKKFLRLDDFLNIRRVVSKKGPIKTQKSLNNFVLNNLDESSRFLFYGAIMAPQLMFDTISDAISTAYFAIQDRRVLTLNYTDAKKQQTVRDVEPMEIFYQDHNWYLWAFCRKRNDLRVFKLKIEDYFTKTNRHFIRRPFDLLDGTNDPRDFRDKYFVSLEFPKKMEKRVQRDFAQDKILILPDKVVILEKDLYNQNFAMTWLDQFKDRVTINEPRDLKFKYEQQGAK